jgi:hypothetical protein
VTTESGEIAGGGAAEPTVIALVTLENLHNYRPDGYVGLVTATGSSVYEAAQALEERAVLLARKARTDAAARGEPIPAGQVYAVLGLRFTAGITASGEPDWAAYGTPGPRPPRTDLMA